MQAKLKIAVVVVVLIIICTLCALFLFNGPPPPKDFVMNRTFETHENLLFVYEMTRYPSDVEVTNPEEDILLGVTVDPWNLGFGIIPKGSYERRFLNLVNLEENNVKVGINPYGDIAPMISFNKNNFILRANESITVDVILRTTNTTVTGNYTGEIDIIIVKPKYDFLYHIL